MKRKLRFSQRVWHIISSGLLRGFVALSGDGGQRVGRFDYIAPVISSRSSCVTMPRILNS